MRYSFSTSGKPGPLLGAKLEDRFSRLFATASEVTGLRRKALSPQALSGPLEAAGELRRWHPAPHAQKRVSPVQKLQCVRMRDRTRSLGSASFA